MIILALAKLIIILMVSVYYYKQEYIVTNHYIFPSCSTWHNKPMVWPYHTLDYNDYAIYMCMYMDQISFQS